MASRDIACLPLTAVHRVLAFAAPFDPKSDSPFDLPEPFMQPPETEYYADDVVPFVPALPTTLCETLGRVSPAFLRSMCKIQLEHVRRVLTFEFETGSQGEVAQFAAEIAHRGGSLKCLRIRSPHDLNGIVIDWFSVLARCPTLRRLSLQLPLASTHLVGVLEAASRQCLHLESLRLPVRYETPPKDFPRDHHVPRQVDAMIQALYNALKAWFTHGRRGGLRQLTVPQRWLPKSEDENPKKKARSEVSTLSRCERLAVDTDTFLRAVADYCPNIEFLDGTDAGYISGDDHMSSTEIWYGSIDAWEYVCSRCTNLRRLNWYSVPYVDDFFQVFAKYPKPHLTSLALPAIETLWDQLEFFNGDVYGEYYGDDDNWVCTAEAFALLPTACPALQELRIRFCAQGTVADALAYLPDVMTDAFFVAVAEHCKQLRVFEMTEFDSQGTAGICDVTDVGVCALATLPSLRSISLEATECGSAALFALMEHAPKAGLPRRAFVQVYPDVEDVIVGLLDLVLGRHKELEGRRYEILLRNSFDAKNWNVGDALLQMEAIEAAVPTLLIRLENRHGEPLDLSDGKQTFDQIRICSSSADRL